MLRFGKLLRFGILVAAPSLANTHVRPTQPEQLKDLFMHVVEDKLVRVPGAQVTWVNNEALRRDFPSLDSMSESEIDAWVLHNFAFIGEDQLKMTGIRNTHIPVTDISEPQAKKAYRPQDWNRAAFVPAYDMQNNLVGLVDIKGIGLHSRGPKLEENLLSYAGNHRRSAGLEALRKKDHSDGLMSYGEAVAEVSRQRAIQKLFDIEGARKAVLPQKLETVESYFTIALPFGILKEDSSIQAALYGRQSHAGHHDPRYKEMFKETGYDWPYEDIGGGFQHDKHGAAVDFGSVVITDKRIFENYSFANGTSSIHFEPQKSRAWIYGHDVATATTRQNNPDTKAIYRHLSEMEASLENEWREARKKLGPSLDSNSVAAIDQALSSPNNETVLWGLDSARVSNASGIVELLRKHAAKIGPPLWMQTLAYRADTESLRELAKLSELHPTQVSEALLVFEKAPQKINLALLKTFLTSPFDKRVHESAITIAGLRSDSESLELLHQAATSTDAELRTRAWLGMANRGDPKLETLLSEAPDAEQTAEKLIRLLSRKNRMTIRTLKLLSSHLSGDNLASLIGTLSPPFESEIIEMMVLWAKHPSKNVRFEVASKMYGVSAGEKISLALTKDSEQSVRKAAEIAVQSYKMQPSTMSQMERFRLYFDPIKQNSCEAIVRAILESR